MDNEDVLEDLTEEDRNLLWEVNALLSALHEGSIDLYEAIITGSENALGLLVMANATLKSMVDMMIETINEMGLPEKISFPDLIRLAAEMLTSVKNKE